MVNGELDFRLISFTEASLPMSKLTALRKQIAALEAEFSRTAKAEMEAAVGKVRALMSSLGVTVDYLVSTSSSEGSRKARAKTAPSRKPVAKRAAAGVARYRDPATGATWTGFGRAPGWIAKAKSREPFLIGGAPASAEAAVAVEAVSARKKGASRKAAARKSPKTAGKKVGPSKAASRKTVAKKEYAVKAPSAKKPPAKKTSAKKTSAKRAATPAAGAAERAKDVANQA